MATTSPDNIWTPDSGDDYALTVDLAAMADSVQDAVNAHKTYRVGTNAERLALVAPELRDGIVFQTTDGSKLKWTYMNSSWVQLDRASETSGVFTAASGWTVSSQRAVQTNGMIYAYFSLTRTGGTINVNDEGDITNIQIGTVAADWRPPFEVVLGSGNAGRVASGYVNSAGSLYLTSVGGSANITNTKTISLGGTYPANSTLWS